MLNQARKQETGNVESKPHAVLFSFTVCRMAASASPTSVTSPQEAGPANIIKMFTTYTNVLTEASMCKCSRELAIRFHGARNLQPWQYTCTCKTVIYKLQSTVCCNLNATQLLQIIYKICNISWTGCLIESYTHTLVEAEKVLKDWLN